MIEPSEMTLSNTYYQSFFIASSHLALVNYENHKLLHKLILSKGGLQSTLIANNQTANSGHLIALGELKPLNK